MTSPADPGTRAWLAKAWSDLRSAKGLAAMVDPPLDTAIYHCQQVAEKAMKAFLCHGAAPIAKTHDVVRLVIAASALDSSFNALSADADTLAPLATAFRYPDESDWSAPMEPTHTEFDEALAAAQRIYDFVLSRLPITAHPV